jgi:RNA polymerase sigma factor (sigma-70 family)
MTRGWTGARSLVTSTRRVRVKATADIHRRLLLTHALDELPPRQRAAVVLRYFEDLSLEQTAAALGCSVGTARSQTSRALAKLRSFAHLDALLQERH